MECVVPNDQWRALLLLLLLLLCGLKSFPPQLPNSGSVDPELFQDRLGVTPERETPSILPPATNFVPEAF